MAGEHKKPVPAPTGVAPQSHVAWKTGLGGRRRHRPGEGRAGRTSTSTSTPTLDLDVAVPAGHPPKPAGSSFPEQLARTLGGQGVGPAERRSPGGPHEVTNWSTSGGTGRVGGMVGIFGIFIRPPGR